MSTYDLLDNLFDQLPETVLWVLQVNVIDELGNNLRIRFRLEMIALQLQELLDVLVIGHNAVVHYHKCIASIRAMGMRVQF